MLEKRTLHRVLVVWLLLWSHEIAVFALDAATGVCSSVDSAIREPSLNIEEVESQTVTTREFWIDYENDQFLLDEEPFRYVSGSLHYFRVPRVYWRDRLRKLRAAGLNAVCTYVEWSQHEPSPGVYNFTGELDIIHFFQLAQEEGLHVILRPGPYICAEREMVSSAVTRHYKHSVNYQARVQSWLNSLMTLVQPQLYGNGGPIILVQVENEYGSYFACDYDHTSWLRDQFSSYVGTDAVLFTTDGAGDSYLRCGKIDGVFATVDFGSGTNVSAAFHAMRNHQAHGPLVNSEFYPGWLSHWDEAYQTVGTNQVTKTLDEILAANASVNLYMFFGGTNFGFMSGANYGSKYEPQLTSYDYDAPLTEAGDPTGKYFAIREVVGRYLPLPDLALPETTAKGEYGVVSMFPVVSLLEDEVKSGLGTPTVFEKYPLTFEALGQSYGFVLYETMVPSDIADPSLLDVKTIGDRALVFLDKVLKGVLSRSRNITTLSLITKDNQTLQILVENQGRINYGSKINDTKGLLSNVTLDDSELTQWNMTGFPMSSISWLQEQNTKNLSEILLLPAFYRGEFQLPENNLTLDTYLDPTGWDKGVAFINDYNLGRYWPRAGPQVTLYVPGSFLRPYPETNTIVLLELEGTPNNLQVKFVSEPNLGNTNYSTKKCSAFLATDIEIPGSISGGTIGILPKENNLNIKKLVIVNDNFKKTNKCDIVNQSMVFLQTIIKDENNYLSKTIAMFTSKSNLYGRNVCLLTKRAYGLLCLSIYFLAFSSVFFAPSRKSGNVEKGIPKESKNITLKMKLHDIKT
uniref:Beta-galactosidase n=1 Tax=Timema shepardi TaxID=629360 RepID=A0A7R9G2D3_TIMSH|nr:unnamed protein product [Timema shepardi]